MIRKIVCLDNIPAKVWCNLKEDLIKYGFDLVGNTKEKYIIMRFVNEFKTKNNIVELSTCGFAVPKHNLFYVKYPFVEKGQSQRFKFLLIVLHEIYHVLGLEHCKDKNCIMGVNNRKYCFNNFKENIDFLFCKYCYNKLKELKEGV